MENRMELRLTGSGGQGIILASIILAEGAILAGKNAVQTQSYGPEARGGKCKAEIIISDGPVGFFKVVKPTFLLALTQQSLDEYSQGLPPGCAVMADESLKIPQWVDAARVMHLPILRTAAQVIGKSLTANIVAVGAINKALSLCSEETMTQAVGRRVPHGTEELNYAALREGAKLL